MKIQIAIDQEIAQTERNSNSKNRDEMGKRSKLIRYLYKGRVSSYFPIGSYSVTQTLLKYENVHKDQTAQKFNVKTYNN